MTEVLCIKFNCDYQRDEWNELIIIDILFDYVLHEKGFQFHAQPLTGAYSCYQLPILLVMCYLGTAFAKLNCAILFGAMITLEYSSLAFLFSIIQLCIIPLSWIGLGSSTFQPAMHPNCWVPRTCAISYLVAVSSYHFDILFTKNEIPLK